MKKLLIIGGGFLQTFVIKQAHNMGYEVHVVDANPCAEGFKYADYFEVIDVKDEVGCLSYALNHEINGVLTAATDFPVLVVSRIVEELGLPGIHYDVAKIIKNKAAVRKCLFEVKADDTGYSYEIQTIAEIPDILPLVKYPLMIKPVDGSGSRGASRIDSAEEFAKACEFAMAGSISHRAVAEPFVVGKEYGVESFVDQGKIHILGIMQKEMTRPPYYAELGHAIPSGLSKEMENKIKVCVEKALIALGVNHGSVNMDLLIGDDGDVHIVDVGARMGGNLIGSHIIPIGTGIPYMENMIRAAVGDPTDFSPVSDPRPVATKLLALTPGRVIGLPDFDAIEKQCDVKIEHHLHVGDTINEYHTNLDGCGYVVAVGRNVGEAVTKATLAKERIDNEIQRG